MKYSEAKQGRIFVIRLEDGDIVHECIEHLAIKNNIKAGYLIAVGGADKGSTLVVGPKDGRSTTISGMLKTIEDDAHEIVGTGTLFPDDTGNPVLHMHMACGRENKTITGCIRPGVKTWQILEIILTELTDTKAVRLMDNTIGLKLLTPNP
ncbi:MAG: DNA-binding protein [Alphaproteobacteria bacterium]|nr:DNA-binding protein [Alphaproteobacteria bacterium]